MKALKRPLIPRKPRRRPGLADLLLEISNKIAVAQRLSEAFDILANLTTSLLGAERGSIFLNDARTNELYTRVQSGKVTREIRILNHLGIAGHVFTAGQGIIVNDAYSDDRFNQEIDKATGFVTRNILCVPLRTLQGKVIGVSELLNKKDGPFSQADLELLEALVRQAAIALESVARWKRSSKTGSSNWSC